MVGHFGLVRAASAQTGATTATAADLGADSGTGRTGNQAAEDGANHHCSSRLRDLLTEVTFLFFRSCKLTSFPRGVPRESDVGPPRWDSTP